MEKKIDHELVKEMILERFAILEYESGIGRKEAEKKRKEIFFGIKTFLNENENRRIN